MFPWLDEHWKLMNAVFLLLPAMLSHESLQCGFFLRFWDLENLRTEWTDVVGPVDFPLYDSTDKSICPFRRLLIEKLWRQMRPDKPLRQDCGEVSTATVLKVMGNRTIASRFPFKTLVKNRTTTIVDNKNKYKKESIERLELTVEPKDSHINDRKKGDATELARKAWSTILGIRVDDDAPVAHSQWKDCLHGWRVLIFLRCPAQMHQLFLSFLNLFLKSLFGF